MALEDPETLCKDGSLCLLMDMRVLEGAKDNRLKLHCRVQLRGCGDNTVHFPVLGTRRKQSGGNHVDQRGSGPEAQK